MNASALASLITATFTTLQADRDAAVSTVADRRDAAQTIVDAGAGSRENASPFSAIISQAAFDQAAAYLKQPLADQIRDELAHHVFNTLRTTINAADVSEVVTVDKLQLLNAAPALLDAEVIWRTKAKTDDTLATLLNYWDRATTFNPTDALVQKIFDVLVTAGIATAPMLTQIVKACTITRPGAATTLLEQAQLSDATIDDVLTALAAGGF